MVWTWLLKWFDLFKSTIWLREDLWYLFDLKWLQHLSNCVNEFSASKTGKMTVTANNVTNNGKNGRTNGIILCFVISFFLAWVLNHGQGWQHEKFQFFGYLTVDNRIERITFYMICNKELPFNSIIYTLNPISQVKILLYFSSKNYISGPVGDTKCCQSYSLRMPPPRFTEICNGSYKWIFFNTNQHSHCQHYFLPIYWTSCPKINFK